jgi:hypothetical protein
LTPAEGLRSSDRSVEVSAEIGLEEKLPAIVGLWPVMPAFSQEGKGTDEPRGLPVGREHCKKLTRGI